MLSNKFIFCFTLFSIYLVGCTPNVFEQEGASSQMELVLQGNKESYLIGSPILFQLQIINHNPFPIIIDGLFYKHVQGHVQFSFTPPNAVRLIAPNGEDLFTPYINEESLAEDDFSFVVDSESENWISFSLSEFQHLRQAGEYSFWVELEDNSGTVYQSNIIQFEVQDAVDSIPIENVDLTLSFDQEAYTIEELLNLDVEFEYTFTNKSSNDVAFLKPQTPININLLNPMYELTIIDELGRHLSRQTVDALKYNEPVYDESTILVLQSGESSTQRGSFLHFPGILNSGVYWVQLTYIVHEANPTDGTPMNWEDSVFRGVLKSNEVTLTIEE